ncbi:PAS domain-containing hybrid sensor histidine kinase/response regulator [Mucilaginibacter celer]|uniref:Sensory/regulatory protein RpfC n=1 Tax=Mucilaginibacter celer TaxID=2305508 RepID=A0A494VN63_9SPHI|nr:PAS domain-containing hybrid sensor histidine kinase/response regulator [Mucilaginibacter celer]AYL95151.1 PAS domain S-box protein [Mucilaginibacter celer]
MDQTSVSISPFFSSGGFSQDELQQLAIVAVANENGVVFNDNTGKISWVNNSFCKMMGYDAHELIGNYTFDFCKGPLTRPETIARIEEAIGTQTSFNEQLIHYRKDGSWFWARVKGQSYPADETKALRYFAVIEDISVEKAREEKLEVLSKIAEENINAVILTDKHGHVTWVNKGFTKITGYTLSEVVNKKPGHLLQGPQTDKETVNYLRNQIAQGQPFAAEIINYSKSGRKYWLRIQGQPILNSNGELSGFFALEEDVTNEKKASEHIKESEARFRLALEKIGDNVWEHNLITGETIFSKTNHQLNYRKHFKNDQNSFWWELADIKDQQLLKSTYLKYKKGEIDSHSLEYKVIDSNGGTRWILDRGVVIEYNNCNMPVRITGTHTDISKIKQTEIELENRAMQFKALSENIPGVIYEYEFRRDGTEGLRYISPAIERIFGIKPDDFSNYLNYIGPADRDRIIKKNEHCKKTLEPFYDESVLLIPGQPPKWHSVYSSFSYLSPNGSKVFTGFMNDITERKNVEEALKNEEEKYRGIIDNMNLGLVEVDMYENITFANNTFCLMSGYALNELLGKNAATLLASEETKNIFHEKNELRKKGVSDAYQVKLNNKQGNEKWWLISGAPRYNNKGEQMGSIGIHLDITEQKRQEEELIDAKKHAEHLARVQENFLANMSHEIRTPMNAIMGMSNQLSKTALSPQQQFYLDVINSASESLLIIINDILDLSKIEAGKLNIENIGFEPRKSAARVIQVLSHKAEEKGLRLINSYFDDKISPILIGDPYRLNQILLNLVNNSVKFTEMGTIDLTFKLISDTLHSQLLQIEVKDTGIGMDETFLKHLFDKYSQETKSVSRKYGGTGLGMSICKDLVELMGGQIFAESRKHEGTKITLTIEFKKGSTADLPSKPEPYHNVDFLRGKNVLVTDDNELNRLVALVILQNYGASVTESISGVNALELIKKQNFDAILMDIQMPGINGLETAKMIRGTGNKSPIIALTAEAIKGEREKCLAAGMNDYITKPINEAEFLKVLDLWLQPRSLTSPKLNIDMSSDSPMYDLSLLKAISKDNEAFVQKMVNIFCEQTPAMISDMQSAYNKGDLGVVRLMAHKMKPSIDNLKINSIKQTIRDIESSEANETDKVILAHNIQLLHATVEKVIAKIRNEYPA